jgi:hypothetical protein
MRTFSSTVMCGKTAEIWNERKMPVRDLGGAGSGDVAAVEEDLAAAGRQELGNQVETGGLAGAVGADQGVDVAAFDLEVDLADRRESLDSLVSSLVSRMTSAMHSAIKNVRTSAQRSLPAPNRLADRVRA